MLRAHLVLLTYAMLFSQNSIAQQPAAFQWPYDTKVAVSLAYDDTLASQLDIAVPALNARGLKASFYLQLSSPLLIDRIAEWRAVAQQGHELGNHSLFHQCAASLPGRGWVVAQNDLDNISAPQMAQQVRLGNTMLRLIDGKIKRTFTAPCGDVQAGGEPYLPLLQNDFVAIKAGTGGVIRDMLQLNPYAVHIFAPTDMTGSELIALVQQADKYGGMVNITFHGIGGDYLPVSAAAHAELLDYLHKHRSIYWTDTFIAIMQHVKQQQAAVIAAPPGHIPVSDSLDTTPVRQ